MQGVSVSSDEFCLMTSDVLVYVAAKTGFIQYFYMGQRMLVSITPLSALWKRANFVK